MRVNVIFLTLCLLWGFVACNNEDDEMTTVPETKSILKFSESAPVNTNVNAVDFTLKNAGIYNNHLYACLEYVGGNKAHEFAVSWDGNISDDKVIQLDVYHLTNDDNGTKNIQDSLYIDMVEFNISETVLADPDLKFDVVNTTNPGNHFVVKIKKDEPAEVDDVPVYVHYYDYELTVVESPCANIGEWEQNWLKSNSKDSVLYFIPAELDEEITYAPKLNDKVKVKLQYTAVKDVEGSSDCDFIKKNNVAAIKIKEIELINE